MLSEEQIDQICEDAYGSCDEQGTVLARHRLARAIEAAVLPEGWVAVPKEPTDTMLYMMCRAINTKEERIDSYKEMLAAAPGVQTGEKDNAEVNGVRLADRPSEAV